MMTPFQSSMTLLLILVVAFNGAAAFQASNVLPTRAANKNSSSKLLFFHWDDYDQQYASTETIDLETAIEKSVGVGSLLLATAAENPELESEVLMDVSHLFLDFSVFVTQNKPFLDVAQVIGRVLILAQDYIPDRHIQPEELGIQVVMIATCIAKRGRKPQGSIEKHD
uniref:Uncharacterized protein n=1 Tax=Pseudo-nitzschia delicatissima TaxID=44447 RepID=A0A7S0TAU1_9STRA|mmetsp:Transcript_854/g.1977  ORF Transcript_854/g.1977 Transcript_854/m.1977 type:complete len:168 (+) Transcript_854:257-760(+)